MKEHECWDIKKQIMEFSVENNVDIRILSQEEKEKINNRFREKYIREDVRIISYSVFEALKYEYVGIDIPDSWK